jgi:serine phosphatase RsbU (regulator of sigma subunit)/PAS domain-containing protein
MPHDDRVDLEVIADDEALWRLVTALASAVTPFEVAEAFTKEGALAAGGTFANMALLSETPDLVQVVHRPVFNPEVVAQRGMFDLGANTPVCEAIRSGLPVLLGSTAEIRARYPELLTEIEQAGLSSRASLPLHAVDGATLGAIGIGWPESQVFTAPQLRRLDLLAQLVGLALERATQNELHRSNAAPRPSVVETMPNAFFSLDAALTITYMNAEAERLARMPRDRVLGASFVDAFTDGTGNELATRCRHAIATGASIVFEAYFAPLEGWFEVHAWPDRQGLNVYFSDVSERHRSELEQTVALDEARQAHARLSFLAELSSKLHGVHTRTELYDRLARVVTTSMADWSTIVVPSGNELIRVAAHHRDPILNNLARRLVGGYPHPFTGPSPGVVVYRSGQPLRLPHLAEQIVNDLDSSVSSAAYGRTLQLLGDGPGLIMPVVSDQGVVAVLTMVRRNGELFSDEDVAIMAEALANVTDLLEEVVRLETQRETASALQAAALPKTLPASARLHLAAGYRAASEGTQVGGDWYDAFELQSGHIALVVGDAAGHGLQAAALMTQIRNALRAHLFESLGPSESLAKLSGFVATQEPEAFATVICVEIDPRTGVGVWASAGHPAPILLRQDGRSRYLQGKPGPPIGSGDSRPIEHDVLLAPDDRLVMFTDGLFERRGVDLDIGLTHLMITTEQTFGDDDASSACEFILREMLTGAHDDDVCLLIADFSS